MALEYMQISKQLDYKKEKYLHPKYKYRQILPFNGSQTVAITTSGGQETLFIIPKEVVNLSKCDLRFTVTGVALADNSNWFINDCLAPIRNIQLYTNNTVYLADLSEVANMTKVIWKAEIPFNEYITYDRFSNNFGVGRYLRANNAESNSNTRTELDPFALRYDGSNANVNYLEPKYLEPGNIDGDDPIFNISIPLEMLKNRIFELDKNLYFGETITMRIVWNQSTRIAFTSELDTDPTDTTAILTTPINISDLSLYLAIEQNHEIINQLRTQVLSKGFQILIPYTYTDKINLGGTSQTVTKRLNRAHGIRLKKIYHSVFKNNETSSTSYDISNVLADRKVNVFYTELNDVRLQEYNLNLVNHDDYISQKDKLKGSVILSFDIYYYNWFWLDDFSGINNFSSSDNIESGIDLSVPQKWVFNGISMTNSNFNHYTFSVTQKLLTVSSIGITVA